MSNLTWFILIWIVSSIPLLVYWIIKWRRDGFDSLDDVIYYTDNEFAFFILSVLLSPLADIAMIFKWLINYFLKL